MVLIQVLLPITAAVRDGAEDINAVFALVRRELVDLVDGVSACLRSAAEVSTDTDSDDEPPGVRIEVLATTFD